MPLPLIPNVIRASVEGTMPLGPQWINVIHFRKSGASSYASAITTLDPLLYALWNSALGTGASLKGSLTTNWHMVRIRYTPLDGSTVTTIIPHALVGTEPGEALPANVALVASLYSDKRGRSGRGRTYIGGWGEQQNNGGQVTAATLTAVQNQFTAWLASFTATGLMPVVASYTGFEILPRTTPKTYGPPEANDVQSIVVNGTWDTQRRRLR